MVRSTEAWSREASGETTGAARDAAIADVPAGYELISVGILSAKPGEPVTVKAIARALETKPVEASGADYSEAYSSLRLTVPEGWQLQGVLEG